MHNRDVDESPRGFAIRVRDALLRILALIVLLGAHRLLDLAIEWLVPHKLSMESTILGAVSSIVVTSLYVYLMWDMLRVFIPWLNSGGDSDQPVANLDPPPDSGPDSFELGTLVADADKDDDEGPDGGSGPLARGRSDRVEAREL